MIKKYISFINNKSIKESKEKLEDVMDSFLELTDDGFITYNGLSIISDPRESSDKDTKKLVGNFIVKTSNIIDKTNINNYIKLYDTINYALNRVNVEDFFIIKNFLKIIFNINEPSRKFISNLEIGDYFYYIETPFCASIDIDVKDDFTFILKLYAEDISTDLYPNLETKEALIEYFKQFNIEYVNCIKEEGKYDQYIFKGNFI